MKIGRGNRSTRKRNLPQRHFVHHKSHLTSRRCGKPATNRLSYEVGFLITYVMLQSGQYKSGIPLSGTSLICSSKQRRRNEMHMGFWWDIQNQRDIDIGGRIILKWILER
jgi:hypothetical protein